MTKSKNPLEFLKERVVMKHPILSYYSLHPLGYCILDVVNRTTQKREYANVTKLDLARFLRIKPNLFSYHYKKLIEKKYLEYKDLKGFRIIDGNLKDDMCSCTGGTFTVIDLNLFEKLEISIVQYCIMHSVFVTNYLCWEKYSNTSKQKFCNSLNISRTGFEKAVKSLEQFEYMFCFPYGLFLNDLLVIEFYSVHDEDFKKLQSAISKSDNTN